MTTRIEISDELRAEIANAVESIGVTCPEQVCDKLIELAAADKDWRAELAAAKQRERLTADGLLDSREIADALAAEIEQDTDGAVECSVVEMEVDE